MMTTTTTRTDLYKSTYHRDGTVTLWDCYRQRWTRPAAGEVSDQVLATLSAVERKRIARMAAQIGGAS